MLVGHFTFSPSLFPSSSATSRSVFKPCVPPPICIIPQAGAALGRRTENATRTTLLWMRGADVEQHFFSDAELPFWQESNFRYLSGQAACDLCCDQV